MSASIRGERVRELREKLGLTQGQLAALCGLTLQQIHRYESGKSDTSGSGLKSVAEQLHVTTDYLLGLSDDPHGYGALELREDERKVLEAYTMGDLVAVVRLTMQRIDALEGQKQTPNSEG